MTIHDTDCQDTVLDESNAIEDDANARHVVSSGTLGLIGQELTCSRQHEDTGNGTGQGMDFYEFSNTTPLDKVIDSSDEDLY